ncbi:uncharacterized protein RHO25_003161 [Cercospora beticola]|uniref:Uncharacterized protein n=1 Tax=Cercospora beticola TaxID=122368 RepID=A0ABZ0NGF4_CERBT|nr:hypothetical protein RHO25_003161 [Cercospora beticola]
MIMAERDAAGETTRKHYPDYKDSNASSTEKDFDEAIEQEEDEGAGEELSEEMNTTATDAPQEDDTESEAFESEYDTANDTDSDDQLIDPRRHARESRDSRRCRHLFNEDGSQTAEQSAAEELVDEDMDEDEEEELAAELHTAQTSRKGQPDAFLCMVANIREVLLRNIRQWQSRHNKM